MSSQIEILSKISQVLVGIGSWQFRVLPNLAWCILFACHCNSLETKKTKNKKKKKLTREIDPIQTSLLLAPSCETFLLQGGEIFS